MSTPHGPSPTKLNRLLKQWPHGMVATSDWLKKQGVSRQLADTYKRYAWVAPVGHGAYSRAGDTVRWTGALHAVQRDPNSGVHAAGKTALEILGYTHFLSADQEAPFWLLGSPGERLPAWFAHGPWSKALRYAAAGLFAPQPQSRLGLTEREVDGLPMRLSAPERAILEVLYFVPQQQSFEEARLLFEGLNTLRVKLLQSLLEACAFVKVKRLFLALADASGHPWVSQLDPARLDLGVGKRQIVRGGRLHPKYLITLPADFLRNSESRL
jgi:hypothetical protein